MKRFIVRRFCCFLVESYGIVALKRACSSQIEAYYDFESPHDCLSVLDVALQYSALDLQRFCQATLLNDFTWAQVKRAMSTTAADADTNDDNGESDDEPLQLSELTVQCVTNLFLTGAK